MARDERLKKAQDAGADFVETARSKAEELLRDLARAGGDTQGRAQVVIDELVESGRKGTELFTALVRKEIQNQLSALGLATKADLADLERRLADLERRLGGRPGDPASARRSPSAPAQPAARAEKAPAPKAAAPKAAAPKKAAPKKAAPKAAAQKAKKAPAKKAPAKKANPNPAG